MRFSSLVVGVVVGVAVYHVLLAPIAHLLFRKAWPLMAADLSALVDQVAATSGVEASAVTFIQGLIAQLQAAQGNPAQVQALVDQLKTSTDALAAAIATTTPPPPPTP